MNVDRIIAIVALGVAIASPLIAYETFNQSKESLTVAMAQEPNRRIEIEAGPNENTYAPQIKAKWRILLSNNSTMPAIIKSYLMKVQYSKDAYYIEPNSLLYYADTDKELQMPVSIDAGKSLTLEGQFIIPINAQAYEMLKVRPQPMTLVGAESFLEDNVINRGSRDFNDHTYTLFGVTQWVPVNEKHHPMDEIEEPFVPRLILELTSARNKKFEFNDSYNGSDLPYLK
jgi:hypothetical protein